MNKDKFIPEEEYKKCAPTKEYTDGSCFNLKSLKKIANAYNNDIGKNSNKIINLELSKSELVSEISKRISECGINQLCWLDVDFVKNTRDNEILKNTFRPKGPQGRFKWLSTTDINQVIKQYEEKYKDFKFFGAVPIDFEELEFLGLHNLDFNELVDSGITRIGMVINLDESWKSGSHWVALYADLDKYQIYYYDSYGIRPKLRIRKFIKKISKWCYEKKINKEFDLDENDFDIMDDTKKFYDKVIDIRYNKMQHQRGGSECGVYSVNFILRLLKGETFSDINKTRLDDNVVNECRKTYFRFE